MQKALHVNNMENFEITQQEKCQEKFLQSHEIETGTLKLPFELRIKPGEWSGSRGSDAKGNFSAKRTGGEKRL